MMTALNNPALPSDFTFENVIYSSPGINYAGVPVLNQYNLFDAPAPDYKTGRLDISAFADLGAAVPWPFPNTAVPLNGLLRVPRGRGPFPLAIFAHGNHNPFENSTPGYIYLCELLASHGILAATIDVNFLNGWNFGENDARAIVHLEHIKQFRAWDSLSGHPLCGKVNLNRTMIVGHSRGGEGVGHASFFNRLGAIQPTAGSPVVPLDGSKGLGPYRFELSVVAAIAPTDRQYEPVSGPTAVPDDYFLIHGSRDGDVSSFEGYNTYDRAHAIDLANPVVSDGKLKALLWLYGANHNQFNSVWPSETPVAATLPRAEQEQVAKAHLGALAQAALLDRRVYWDVLRDHSIAAAWVPPRTVCVSQYQDSDRLFIQHNQESLGAPQVSLPVQGNVFPDSVVTNRQVFDLVNSGRPGRNITLRVQWNSPNARLLFEIDPTTLAAERYSTFSFRVGQSTEASNVPDRDQDFSVEVSSGSRTIALAAASLHRLVYPDVVFGFGKIVMQTIRLPLSCLAEHGIDLNDIRRIALVFDRRPAGTLYIGELQVSG
jgi:hypothetical protein